MFSQPIYIVTILLIILAVGELISIWSHARIPSLLVVMVGYLILSWLHFFPEGVITSSPFTAFGSLMVAPLVVHMGTLIPIRLIRSQYKAILIALMATLTATVLILLIVSPIYGYATAVSGAGPVTGGVIAYLITTERLQELNLAYLITVPAVILGIHSLVGMPVALNILRKYAVKLQKQGYFTQASVSVRSASIEQKKSRSIIPERLQTPPILLLLLFIGGSLAVFLNNVTGLNYSIWALVFGVVGHVIGLFPARTLDKANTTGIAMVGLIIVVMSSVGSVTLEAVLSSLGPVVLIIVVGVIGVVLGGVIGSKIFKWDPLKGVPVAMTALFGFPGDYIICEEVSRSVGRDEEERKAILDEIFTPMLVGGFTTVTTASILVASILVGTL